ncbi:MAG: ParA family protein [Candidatus Kariarchaeaceae archaeon]
MTHSYKGGSGKTLFSVNAAKILTEVYNKRVLLIETDFQMPVFINIYDKFKPDIFLNDYLNQSSNPLDHYIYPDVEGDLGIIYCTPEFSPNDRVFTMDPKWYEEKLSQLKSDLAKTNYDFVIFDLAPGKNLFSAVILVLSEIIFNILRPDSNSVLGAKSLFSSFYTTVSRLTNKDIRIIFNQIPKLKEMENVLQQWRLQINESSQNITHFYNINFDHNTSYNVAKNSLILDPSDPTSSIIENIVNDLL